MDKFMLGLGLGMIGGILFAPRSGSETRRMIGDKAVEGVDYVKGVAGQGYDQVKSMASDGVDYMKSKTDDLGSIASSFVDKGKSVLQREGEQVREAVDEYQPA